MNRNLFLNVRKEQGVSKKHKNIKKHRSKKTLNLLKIKIERTTRKSQSDILQGLGNFYNMEVSDLIEEELSVGDDNIEMVQHRNP